MPDIIGLLKNAAGAVSGFFTAKNNTQLLDAGKAQGSLDDKVATDKKIDAAIVARNDDSLRADTKAKHYRD